MYDTLLQEGKIHPLFKDLDDQYGADQAAYKTVLNIVDRFRERYPNCEWEDEDVDYIDAIEGFATNLLMATLGMSRGNGTGYIPDKSNLKSSTRALALI